MIYLMVVPSFFISFLSYTSFGGSYMDKEGGREGGRHVVT